MFHVVVLVVVVVVVVVVANHLEPIVAPNLVFVPGSAIVVVSIVLSRHWLVFVNIRGPPRVVVVHPRLVSLWLLLWLLLLAAAVVVVVVAVAVGVFVTALRFVARQDDPLGSWSESSNHPCPSTTRATTTSKATRGHQMPVLVVVETTR